MIINNKEYKRKDIFKRRITVPDNWVVQANKVGGGHGEAKWYVGSKDFFDFFGGYAFVCKCFVLKSDLLSYMNSVEGEYLHPSLEYHKRQDFSKLFKDRLALINGMNDISFFTISSQNQITGTRGYINSSDDTYKIIRTICLPNITFFYFELYESLDGQRIFYWKPYVDFEKLENVQDIYALKYGQKTKTDDDAPNDAPDVEELIEQLISSKSSNRRDGQVKYRELLLEQCPFCPITHISFEPLLVASHIKPFAVSNEDEKYDAFNGYILSPLYDKLFDRGYITFTKDKRIIRSPLISDYQWRNAIKIDNGQKIDDLRMDEKREFYLSFHSKNVFQGDFDEIKSHL